MLIEQTEDFSMLVVVFRSSLVEAAHPRRGKRASREVRAILPSRVLSAGNFETLERIWTSLQAGGESAYFNSGLAWLYHEACRCYEEEKDHARPGQVHPAVERAAVWLRHHPETSSFAELARMVGVSSP